MAHASLSHASLHASLSHGSLSHASLHGSLHGSLHASLHASLSAPCLVCIGPAAGQRAHAHGTCGAAAWRTAEKCGRLDEGARSRKGAAAQGRSGGRAHHGIILQPMLPTSTSCSPPPTQSVQVTDTSAEANLCKQTRKHANTCAAGRETGREKDQTLRKRDV